MSYYSAKEIAEGLENIRRIDPHLKGYIYDSLVYRYKYALELGVKERAKKMYCMSDKYINESDALNAAHKQNERDVLRFCEILSEVIGEHD